MPKHPASLLEFNIRRTLPMLHHPVSLFACKASLRGLSASFIPQGFSVLGNLGPPPRFPPPHCTNPGRDAYKALRICLRWPNPCLCRRALRCNQNSKNENKRDWTRDALQHTFNTINAIRRAYCMHSLHAWGYASVWWTAKSHQ